VQAERLQSRRLNPRVEVLGQLYGQLVTWQVPLVIRDVSEGGFSVESEVAFPEGSTHLFRFTTGGSRTLFLNGRCVYSRQVDPRQPGEVSKFVTGFEFVRDLAATDESIGVLLDAVTSMLQFE
jgi:hypothetical protein